MQDSLVAQSKELINKLSQRKLHSNKSIFKSDIRDSKNTSEDLLRCSSNRRLTSKVPLDESMPRDMVTSVLGRSAYLSRSLSKRELITSNGVTQASRPQERMISSTDIFGYDWIAGLMDNKTKESQLDKPADFFDQLDRFRRSNKRLCCYAGDAVPQALPLPTMWPKCRDDPHSDSGRRGFEMDINNNAINSDCQQYNNESTAALSEEPAKPQVFSYTLNERLFPVPLDFEASTRTKPDMKNPHIIKISVPSSRLRQPQPQKSCQPRAHSSALNHGESLSLSSHCSPGQKSYNSTSSVSGTDHSHAQEPASLRGNVVAAVGSSGQQQDGLFRDWLSPLVTCQPTSEEEAINQLSLGKTGAKYARRVPSSLEGRRVITDNCPGVMATRITRQAITEPHSNPHPPPGPSMSFPVQSDNGDHVPRASLSRQHMSRLYGDAMLNINAL